MGTERLYQILRETAAQGGRVLAVVLTGTSAGEKILLRENQVLWQSCRDGFFAAQQDLPEVLTATGILELSGERIFCERLGGERQLVVCGGGHVSMPVIEIGRQIGFRVTVLEDRPLFADHARAAGADQVICDSFVRGMEQIPGGPDTYFVIVTRGHRYDTDCLRAALAKEHAYVGMMGSRKRVALVKEQLLGEGISAQLLDRVHAPIGLAIGARTPEEIAVSIAAELIQVKNQERRSDGYSKELLEQLAGTVTCGEMLPAGGSVSDGGALRAVLAVIVSRRGSAPRGVGTKMLICLDGRTFGTVGGGCVESEVISQARGMLSTQEAHRLIRVDMTGRDAEEEGMVCGGVVELFLETVA